MSWSAVSVAIVPDAAVPGALRASKSVTNRRWVENGEWEEMTVATADTHLISNAIKMCGHERTVSCAVRCCGTLPLR